MNLVNAKRQWGSLAIEMSTQVLRFHSGLSAILFWSVPFSLFPVFNLNLLCNFVAGFLQVGIQRM